ncbi:rhomboid family intramembrane serine protease [Rossellomorea sp. BNER]|nr:rhomboid family intramembrane serine protease [Rossellomorea sp. BNER]
MKKVEDKVNFRLNYLFWRIAYFLIVDKKYRIITMSRNHQELWLENFSEKSAPLIRLLRYDLDWGNWVKRDVELTSYNAEKIRKSYGKRNLSVTNVYVSQYPPVDDYEEFLNKPFVFPKTKKTDVHSYLIDESNWERRTENLLSLVDKSQDIWNLKEEYEDTEVQVLKEFVLTNAGKQVEKERSLFKNGKPFFTYFFIVVQLIIFAFLEMNGGSQNPETLIKYGAKYNPLIIEGEWWRFITPMFLHIGFVHLLMNTLALYFLGSAVERIFGRGRFLFIYLFSGIVGTLASFVFTSNLSAGASGAIFGCFGALLYFGATHPSTFFRTMGMNVIAVIILNLILGFTIPGIDNAGHIGGLIGGFLATGIVHFPRKKKWLSQILYMLLSAAVVSASLFAGFGGFGRSLNPETVNGLAQQRIEEHDFEEASTLLFEVIEDGKPNAQTYFLLSYVEIKQGEINVAENHLQKAIELEPDFHEAHYNLALVLGDKADLKTAFVHAKKALELKPDEKSYQQLVDRLEEQI